MTEEEWALLEKQLREEEAERVRVRALVTEK